MGESQMSSHLLNMVNTHLQYHHFCAIVQYEDGVPSTTLGVRERLILLQP